MYTLRLAWRYTKSRLVNYVAILAVGLALTVQIVVMAVLDGMLLDMEQRVRDTGGQITLVFRGTLPTEAQFADAEAVAMRRPGVRGLTPQIVDYALADHEGWFTPVLVHGIDLAREAAVSEMPHHLVDYKLDPAAPAWIPDGVDARGLPGIFLSARVAEQLGVRQGGILTISYPRRGEKDLLHEKFVVAATFRTGNIFLDEMGAFVPLDAARRLFLQTEEPRVHQFSLWLDDPLAAEERADALGLAVLDAVGLEGGRHVRVRTWMDRWRTIYEGMAYENNLQELILVLMNLSGGFCVFAILATLVSRRVRDVGLLRCIGARRREVVGTFLLIGLFIGVAGAILGLGAGYALAEPGLFFGHERPLVDVLHERLTGDPLYPPRMFLVGSVKPVLGWKVLLYAGGAVLISVLAAAYPAVWAGAREPVEALRDE